MPRGAVEFGTRQLYFGAIASLTGIFFWIAIVTSVIFGNVVLLMKSNFAEIVGNIKDTNTCTGCANDGL